MQDVGLSQGQSPGAHLVQSPASKSEASAPGPPLWVTLSKTWHPSELSCPIHLACRTPPQPHSWRVKVLSGQGFPTLGLEWIMIQDCTRFHL